MIRPAAIAVTVLIAAASPAATVVAPSGGAPGPDRPRELVPSRGPDVRADGLDLWLRTCTPGQGDAAPGVVVESPAVAGPRIGILGDSISSQVQEAVRHTDTYPGDSQVRWAGGAICGATFTSQLPQVPAVLATAPDVVVIALGTNAESGRDDPRWSVTEPAAEALLAATGSAPCRVIVNLAVTDHLASDLATGTRWLTYSHDANDYLHRYVAEHPGTVLYDWAGRVDSDPELLVDRVHLSHDGINARIDGMLTAASTCR